MISTRDENPNHRIICVEGRFDYQLRGDFREAYANVQPSMRTIDVDLRRASYLDSAGLGMLLLLHEFMVGREGEARIISPAPAVKELLDVARFDRYFQICAEPEE
ncbi:MAG: STAS domain-containing protein [Myxococcota bacterium]